MAEWWDAKQGETGDLWHRTLIDPALFALIGDPAGLAVLDLASGNGYLARRLAREGARVTALERSRPLVELVRRRYGARDPAVEYLEGDAAQAGRFESERFDLVVCNMALDDIEDAETAISEVGRTLRPDGRFVLTMAHPCFDTGEASRWVVEPPAAPGAPLRVARKVARVREVFEGEVPWNGPPGTAWRTRTFHRPLPWYFRAFHRAGLVVEELEEPAPSDEFIANSPQGPWIAQVPLHLALAARKLRDGPRTPRSVSGASRAPPGREAS